MIPIVAARSGTESTIPRLLRLPSIDLTKKCDVPSGVGIAGNIETEGFSYDHTSRSGYPAFIEFWLCENRRVFIQGSAQYLCPCRSESSPSASTSESTRLWLEDVEASRKRTLSFADSAVVVFVIVGDLVVLITGDSEKKWTFGK